MARGMIAASVSRRPAHLRGMKGEVERWSIAICAEKQSPILLPQTSGQARAEKIDLAASLANGYANSVSLELPAMFPPELKDAWKKANELAIQYLCPRRTIPRSGTNTSISSFAMNGSSAWVRTPTRFARLASQLKTRPSAANRPVWPLRSRPPVPWVFAAELFAARSKESDQFRDDFRRSGGRSWPR